jgi:hypothetical protein
MAVLILLLSDTYGVLENDSSGLEHVTKYNFIGPTIGRYPVG